MIESHIAIIPARGGSKRIPRKNIREFHGMPIIAYSIEAALKSCIFDEVMVSTDDEEIAEIAVRYGARVPFMRSSETADDHATTADVIAEVLEGYKKKEITYKAFTCIYPTAPFITSEKLIEAAELLNDADAVISVVKYSFPPQRSLVIRDEKVMFQYPQYEYARSQDLEPIYHDCGQFYMCHSDVFIEHRSLILPNTKPYIIKEEEVQDIDTISDWMIAEAKYDALYKGMRNVPSV